MQVTKDFSINSFSRMIFVSKQAKEKWQNILTEVNTFVHNLEIESVIADLRPCTWQTISENQYIEKSSAWTEKGLYSLPIKRVRNFQGFSHRHQDPVPGEVANLCIIIGKNEKDNLAFKAAFEKGDNDTQGRLLGYPKCCRDFFSEVWVKGYYDPVWQAAERSKIMESEKNKMRVKAHPYSTPVLRYTGLRLSFHIPCSFSCAGTIQAGERLMNLAESIDAEKAQILKAFLSMPHSWDVLHGIAVIRTPLFYAVVSSIPTVERYIVEVDGDFFPSGSVRGLTYPFSEVL